MIWPFTRSWPSGLLSNQVVTPAELNKLDEQIAAAADGSLWTDLALVRNWQPLVTADVGTDFIGEALLWEPTVGQWWSFGHKTTNVSTGYRSYSGANWISSPLATDAPATTWTAARSAATNGQGVIVVGGATSGDRLKVRRSGDAGLTWVESLPPQAQTVASGNESVDVLIWAPSAGLFVAGLSSGVGTSIETSPDGITWTRRTAPNLPGDGPPNPATGRQAAAASPTSVVVLADDNADKCITSTDGVSWSEYPLWSELERELPLSDSWRTIAYSAVLKRYLVLGSGGNVAQSADGITWTSAGLTAPPAGGFDFYLCAIGRLWAVAKGNQVFVSADGAGTWKLIENFNFGSGFKFAASPSQLLFVEGDGQGNKTRRTLRSGA